MTVFGKNPIEQKRRKRNSIIINGYARCPRCRHTASVDEEHSTHASPVVFAENTLHPLFIGVKCTFALKMGKLLFLYPIPISDMSISFAALWSNRWQSQHLHAGGSQCRNRGEDETEKRNPTEAKKQIRQTQTNTKDVMQLQNDHIDQMERSQPPQKAKTSCRHLRVRIEHLTRS